MIRIVAALDSRRGIADDNGIPWQGLLPADSTHYHNLLQSGAAILMGRGVYNELSRPYAGVNNYVASRHLTQQDLRPGFIIVHDVIYFLKNFRKDIWNIGGAAIYAETLSLANELYLTRIFEDYKCTKFFPEFTAGFVLTDSTPVKYQNGLKYRFEVWKSKTTS